MVEDERFNKAGVRVSVQMRDSHHNYTFGAELHFEQNYTFGFEQNYTFGAELHSCVEITCILQLWSLAAHDFSDHEPLMNCKNW